MRPVPEQLRVRPFTRAEAVSAGVTSRMLHGQRFVRVFPGVYCCQDHAMSDGDWVAAARMALPDRARLTGITRIQRLGLDYGPRWPLRFVVEGDLHLALDRIFLHRTTKLPPVDDVGVTPAAAYIAYCRRARVVDAIKVGDWLLHHGHMTTSELRDLVLAQRWRDGCDETWWVLDHLHPDSRSLPESETRAVLVFAGLPVPLVNRPLTLAEDVHVIGDLIYSPWRTVVEYEGHQHQDDRGQYLSDLDRYAILRRHSIGYVQVTSEKLRHARTLVGEVHRELVSRGYDGPPPRLDGRWQLLFARITDGIGSHRVRHRGSGGLSTIS